MTTESRKEMEVANVRLENIKLKNKLKKKEQQLKSKVPIHHIYCSLLNFSGGCKTTNAIKAVDFRIWTIIINFLLIQVFMLNKQLPYKDF